MPLSLHRDSAQVEREIEDGRELSESMLPTYFDSVPHGSIFNGWDAFSLFYNHKQILPISSHRSNCL